jgi:two-component system NarL family sensor kinase
MMPRALTTAGLIPALEDLISSSFANSEVQAEFDYGELKKELGEQEKIAIYRIVQEVNANIIKHAQATEFNLQLYRAKDKIMMIAEDNGKGFNVSKLAEGHGLSNIESRAQAIGAKSQFESKEGEGTLCSLSLPV